MNTTKKENNNIHGISNTYREVLPIADIKDSDNLVTNFNKHNEELLKKLNEGKRDDK